MLYSDPYLRVNFLIGMNSTGWVAVIIVLILLIVGGWWYTQQPVATDITSNPTATTTPELPDTTTEPKTVTVDYTSAGFSPKTITIAVGDTVTFTNSSGASMWVGADEHPTHTNYDGTSRTAHCAPGFTPTPFDQCASGATYSFKFDKAGSFDYHNHAAAQFGGTVVVQ